jgi:DnaJ like chaperone protein
LAEAYQAIGVKPDVDDRELKKAYRRLMSENHPDKLSANGVPKEMVELATERSQNITTAYDLIKQSRGLK